MWEEKITKALALKSPLALSKRNVNIPEMYTKLNALFHNFETNKSIKQNVHLIEPWLNEIKEKNGETSTLTMIVIMFKAWKFNKRKNVRVA